jgi:hypothetical protein
MGGTVGLIERAEIREKGGCAWGGMSGGCEGGGGGMWSRHTFSLARLARANKNGCRVSRGIDRKCSGGNETKPEACRRVEMARSEWARTESGADQKGTGKGSRGK